MTTTCATLKPVLAALIAAGILGACGGGGGSSVADNSSNAPAGSSGGTGTTPAGGGTTPAGGGSSGGTGTGDAGSGGTGGTPSSVSLPSALPASTVVTMSCPDGATWQCSGSSVLRIDNGIALTSSGVQTYGKSTSDLAKPIVNTSAASGFAPASGGVAEIRLNRDANGAVSTAALLLNNLGISWDGKTERPTIIEAFLPTQGRAQLGTNGALNLALPLPDSSNLSFYDFATKGAGGTQANYANNRYFPRAATNPPRCLSGVPNCQSTETDGIKYQQGNWRSGGADPDTVGADRLHEDGDIHVGNGQPDANGNPTVLPGGSGFGAAFPGTKGYRSFSDWSFQYANLAAWITQDTVEIVEWSSASNEHNQNRRGITAFGAVTDPVAVPSTGTAGYSGIVEGWYGKNATDDPVFFRGAATITVNFATREVVVSVDNTVASDSAGAAVPVTFKATVGMGAAGSNVANYLTGTVDNGKLKGGVSGRYFGTVASGGSGAGPAEIGGAISLSNPTTGETVVGGFIGRKQ